MIKLCFFLKVILSIALITLIMPATVAEAAKCKVCSCSDNVCKKASENCSSGCACSSTSETGNPLGSSTSIGHITAEIKKHRKWMKSFFFLENESGNEAGLLAAMKLMTAQLTTLGVQQTQVIGSFFDAKHQLETQRLFQQLAARAHKDYHPSAQLCEFGTITQSLSSSARKRDLSLEVLSAQGIDRQLLNRQLLVEKEFVAGGRDADRNNRLLQFIKQYCNKNDNGGHLDLLCAKSDKNSHLYNKDISYTDTIGSALTLDIDFNENPQIKTEDEEALFALNAYLFSHEIFPKIQGKVLVNDDGTPHSGAAFTYQDARAIVAKRSVAMNSINAITAMKAKGDNQSQPFLYAVIKEMGGENMNLDQIKDLIGENPSYHAQMEILTKKLYQNPSFYAELYDKPANVMRKDVAIQAATLMQKRDLYRSYLRSEAILAVMLETSLQEEEERLENEILPIAGGGAIR